MKAFRQVVECGSFVAAAERLKLSSAMMSKHVAHLESHLGARLLHRSTRRLSLTEAGQAYYERCRQALDDLEEAELAIGDANAVPRGTLRVTAPVGIGARHLAPIVSAYTAKHPQVKVELTLSDRVADIVEEGYDLAIRAAVSDLRSASHVARRIASARFVVCAAPAYIKRHGAPRAPADLAQHNCLVFSFGANDGQWRLGSGGGQRVAVSGNLVSNSGEALRAAALAGHGIVFLPTDIVGDDLRARKLLPLFSPLEQPEFGIYAVYASRRYPTAKLRMFVDFLAQRFERCSF